MRKKVLVADGGRHVVTRIQESLTRHGYDAATVTDGRAALSAIEADAPDVLLVDLMLPGIDGATLVQRLQDDEATRGIAVVFLTDLVSEGELRRRGPEIGGRLFLAKPFDEEQLLDAIEMALPAN